MAPVLDSGTDPFMAPVSEPSAAPATGPGIPKVLIVDAMALMQCMRKTSSMKTLSDLQKAFVKRIECMMVGYNEGRVIFDNYIDESLKNKTRQK